MKFVCPRPKSVCPTPKIGYFLNILASLAELRPLYSGQLAASSTLTPRAPDFSKKHCKLLL